MIVRRLLQSQVISFLRRPRVIQKPPRRSSKTAFLCCQGCVSAGCKAASQASRCARLSGCFRLHCLRPLMARSFLPDGVGCQQVLHLHREERQNLSLWILNASATTDARPSDEASRKKKRLKCFPSFTAQNVLPSNGEVNTRYQEVGDQRQQLSF